MKEILLDLLRRAVKCLLASALFSFIYWLVDKSNGFLRPFLIGSLSLFLVFTLISILSFIVTYIRIRRNPEFMQMNIRSNGAIRWRDYKRIKRDAGPH